MDFTNGSAAAGDEIPSGTAATRNTPMAQVAQVAGAASAGAGGQPDQWRSEEQFGSGLVWLCDRAGNIKTLAPMGLEAWQSAPESAPETAGRTAGHWVGLAEEGDRETARAAWDENKDARKPFECVLSLRAFERPAARYITRMLPWASAAPATPGEEGWIGIALEAGVFKSRGATEHHSPDKLSVLDLAAKATNDVIWDWNLITQALWWGENFYSKFGYSREETGPDIQSWKTLIHPEDLDRVAGGIEDAIHSGNEHWEDHYRFRMHSGEYAVIHDRGYIQRNKSGMPERMVGAMIDITRETRSREEILRLNRELEQQVARRNIEIASATTALEAFSYSVSHDLRAPIRHIIGFVELLKRSNGEHFNEEGRRYLSLIVDSGERMGGLIDALLSLSRLGRREIRVAQLELEELVGGIQKDFAVELSGRRIEWMIHPLPSPQGDRVLIRQVFVNLIDNALKYTRVRELARIEIGAADRGNEWEFFVKDNGVGFDMKYAEKLFHVFQRLHSEKDFEGYGVGLANVHRIVSIHGGRVWADSAVDRGTTLFFTLPKSTPLMKPDTPGRQELPS
jgi:PAS domain S-box-containing protein